MTAFAKGRNCEEFELKEVFRTNEPVILSAIEAALNESQIECLVADQFTSMMEGSIGAIQRRVLVIDDDEERARQIIQQIENEIHD